MSPKAEKNKTEKANAEKAPVETIQVDTQIYQVLPDLVKDSSQIKNDMELLQKRLQKMDEHRDQVSESVYFRVHMDYETQLDEVKQKFQKQCEQLEGELASLYKSQEDQQKQLQTHQEILEEGKFRHELGEYKDQKFKEIEKEQNQEIGKYTQILDTIKQSITQYESILGYAYTPKKKEPEKQAPAPAPAAAAEPVVEPKPSEAPLEDVLIKSAPEPELEKASETPAEEYADFAGDYFQAQDSSYASVSTTEPDDDSISNILKNIPLEEEAPAAETPAYQDLENTGARIDIGDFLPEATLLLIEGELDQHEFRLAENTSMGRSPTNDIVLKEARISRQHANISYREGSFFIVDLKSSNGILVNEKKVEESMLTDGDQIQVGGFRFQFNLL